MDSPSSGGATLADYLGVIRRRWWVVGLGLLVGLVVGVAYLLLAPRTYQATAKVLVQSTDNVAGTTAEGATLVSSINLDTEAQLVRSQEVASVAKTELGDAATSFTDEQLIKQVAVTVPPSTTVLAIAATGSSPEEAVRFASAFADAYLANRQDQAKSDLTEQADELKRQRDLLRLEVASLTQRLDSASTGQARAELSSALNDAASQLSAVSSRLAVVSSQQVTPGRIVADPVLPSRPASPNTVLSVMSGAMLGLLLGLVGAFVVDRRDPKVYDLGYLRRRLRVPVLVRVPVARRSAPEMLPPHSPAGQAFVQLRTVLLNALPDGAGIVVILGSDEGTGPDMLAANLAATVARADRNTLLVIADPRSTAPALLGVQGGAGLAEVLRKGAALESVAKQARSVSGLRVVGPGPHLADEVEDLEGAGIGPALDEAAKAAAVVLVLAPPTSRSADAQTLARLSDGALLVVELEHSESAHIRDAVRQLELVGTPMPGAVVFPQLQSRPMAIDPLERASAAAKAK